MSWSATFLADFTQWDQALRQAETKLGAFEQSTLKTKNSLQKMVSEFDGTKVIQQAGTMEEAVRRAGGAATLTDRELRKVNDTLQEAIQKYQRMGQDAPAGLRSMADAVSAQLRPLDDAGKKTTAWGTAFGSVKSIATGFVAGFTVDRILTGIGSAVTSTIEWGGALTDMAAKTGVSTQALQRWEFAANRSGNTLDQVVKASGELSKRLADGESSTVAAVEKLGLNFDRLRQLTPEQQLEEISRALARTSDQGTLASASVDLLGKSGRELLPTLRADLQAVGDEAQRLGIVVNDDTLQAMDSLGDAWGDLKLIGRGLLSEVLEPMVPVLDQLARGFMGLSQPGAISFLEHWAIASGNPVAKIVAGWMAGDRGLTRTQDIALQGQSGASLSELPAYERASFLANGGTVINSEEWYLKSLAEAERRTREMAAARERSARAEAAYRDALAEYTERIAVQDRFMAQFGMRALSVGGPDIRRGEIISQDLTNPWGGVGFLAPGANNPNLSSLMGGRGFPWTSLLQIGGGAFNLFGGSQSTIGQSITGALSGAALGSGISGMMSSIVGASVFGPLAPIAAVVGAAIPFVRSLFGPSRGAILGREADQRMDQTRASLLQQYGSLDAIRATGAQGAALADAWNSRNVQGEQWFNERVRAFEEENQLLGEQRDLQSQIAGIEAQRTALNDSLKTTWDQVVEISGRYGISLEGLGAQVRQLGATTTWTSMLNDIEALTRAGGDMGGILLGMQDEINALVRESLRLGTEIPENMRPYVQALMDAGRLTDANKNSIRDINALRWGPAVQTQADIARTAMEKLDTAMQTLVDRLNEIIDRLANGLPAAAEQGARGAGGALSGIEPPEFRGGSVESFDTGGLIERTQIAQVHRGELIGPVDFMARALAGALERVGSGGARVVQVVLDRRVLAEALVDEIPGALRRAGAF